MTKRKRVVDPSHPSISDYDPRYIADLISRDLTHSIMDLFSDRSCFKEEITDPVTFIAAVLPKIQAYSDNTAYQYFASICMPRVLGHPHEPRPGFCVLAAIADGTSMPAVEQLINELIMPLGGAPYILSNIAQILDRIAGKTAITRLCRKKRGEAESAWSQATTKLIDSDAGVIIIPDEESETEADGDVAMSSSDLPYDFGALCGRLERRAITVTELKQTFNTNNLSPHQRHWPDILKHLTIFIHIGTHAVFFEELLREMQALQTSARNEARSAKKEATQRLHDSADFENRMDEASYARATQKPPAARKLKLTPSPTISEHKLPASPIDVINSNKIHDELKAPDKPLEQSATEFAQIQYARAVKLFDKKGLVEAYRLCRGMITFCDNYCTAEPDMIPSYHTQFNAMAVACLSVIRLPYPDKPNAYRLSLRGYTTNQATRMGVTPTHLHKYKFNPAGDSLAEFNSDTFACISILLSSISREHVIDLNLTVLNALIQLLADIDYDIIVKNQDVIHISEIILELATACLSNQPGYENSKIQAAKERCFMVIMTYLPKLAASLYQRAQTTFVALKAEAEPQRDSATRCLQCFDAFTQAYLLVIDIPRLSIPALPDFNAELFIQNVLTQLGDVFKLLSKQLSQGLYDNFVLHDLLRQLTNICSKLISQDNTGRHFLPVYSMYCDILKRFNQSELSQACITPFSEFEKQLYDWLLPHEPGLQRNGLVVAATLESESSRLRSGNSSPSLFAESPLPTVQQGAALLLSLTGNV